MNRACIMQALFYWRGRPAAAACVAFDAGSHLAAPRADRHDLLDRIVVAHARQRLHDALVIALRYSASHERWINCAAAPLRLSRSALSMQLSYCALPSVSANAAPGSASATAANATTRIPRFMCPPMAWIGSADSIT
jgi:hypothetical protein